MEGLKSLAKEALSYFVVGESASGEEIFLVKDETPFWVRQLIQHAHGGMLPDDWRYSFVLGALSAIESGDFDGAHLETSVYTCELTNWLSSDSNRIAYCDEAYEEHGGRLFDLLQAGQLRERQETFLLVKEFLEDILMDAAHASILDDLYSRLKEEVNGR